MYRLSIWLFLVPHISCLYITNPISATIWQVGGISVLHWEPAGSPSASLEIALLKGDPEDLKVVEIIGSQVESDLDGYSWVVPQDIDSGSDYVVGISRDKEWSYSHYFTIINSNDELDYRFTLPAVNSVE
ncbi:hypothetical protein K493DRAFT_386351 [Basidiobolus meristosporus CBS 931.73]|uniref:Yeast cell wall synthesis Kre9/Knh1-like N-terminal domain-containing protein n=1 Tax=Basidiobolus meristosporus CBS 931.73 TaxID=1314790 RepID=A0A1Y1YWF6_9FUNG|nr:hypothetical protein K493DRAFT_386351 [Basidiobolus meristosporus CBS 931.73]|eukprot:ORY02398.1 hypothetical protein K493DRAFT_386351 [Basidiobolus meristosporus CBS 931.73]